MAKQLAILVAVLAASANALVAGTRPALAPSPLLRLRAQEAPPPPPKGKLGATVDQDGKSNVWVRRAPVHISGAFRTSTCARRLALQC